VLTSDWKSWAYAWLLFLAAIGIGLLLANREFKKSSLINLIGWGLSIAGFTFFVIFGAVAGGLFIEITAPVFLVGIGLLVYWLKPDFNTIAFHSKEQIGYRKASGAASLLEVDTFLAEPLSVREIEVLELINHGFSNAQIASRLTVAQSTVKTHINNIYTKMGVQSRVQAINKARALNLLDN
jgi:DNA-binding CsgD family transcriptional regulator